MLASIITPITESRRKFLPALLQMVADQTYSNIEHVLIWDGGNVGHKRNLGCQRANGEIIIHFDSDDYYAPEWVEVSVQHLLRTGADMTGLSRLYFSDGKSGWEYDYGSSGWVAGATMCYHKSVWKKHPFAAKVTGEDTVFCRGKNIVSHDFNEGFLARVHSGNTAHKNVSGRRYTPVSLPVSLLKVFNQFAHGDANVI